MPWPLDLLNLVRVPEIVESLQQRTTCRRPPFVGQAHPKDLPNLATALCWPMPTCSGHLQRAEITTPPPNLIRVMTPGDLVLRVRDAVAGLAV